MIDATRLKAMVGHIAETIEQEKDCLCALDGVIGDADHGIAMSLGFGAARDAVDGLDETADPTMVLNTAAKSFLNAVGASSGPLYATALMRGAAAVKGKAELAAEDVIAMLQAMAKGIQDRGKAELGEKTMIDAWLPAASAAGEALSQGLTRALSAASEAAHAGAEATKNMVASKGRAERLGERSLGHMDPGAASAAMVIEAMRKSLTD